MQITLEIDDTVWSEIDNQRLILLVGIREIIAEKLPWEDFWRVKTKRCNMCGECCMDITPTEFTPVDDEGKCIYLVNEGDTWRCNAGYQIPLQCVIADPLKSNTPNCVIETENQPVTE